MYWALRFFFLQDVSTHPSAHPFSISATHEHKVTRFLKQKYSSNSDKGPHRETTIRPHTYSNWLTTVPLCCPDTNTVKSIWVCLSVWMVCRRPGSRPQRGSSVGVSLLPLTLLLVEHQLCISLCQPIWYDSSYAIYNTFQMNKYLTIKLEGSKLLSLRPGTLTDTVAVGAWMSGVSSRKWHSLTLPGIAKWAIVIS